LRSIGRFCVTTGPFLPSKECPTNTSQLSEVELTAAARAGQQDAFAEIVERYSGTVYNLALRLMNDPQEAEDVLQETFISAFRALDRFQGRSQLSTWLYRIAYNTALMRLRKRRVPIVSLDEPRETEDGERMPRQLVDWTTVPDELLLSKEFRGKLNTALASLPESLRSVFVLRDIEGLTTAETAAVLGLTETNAKVRLHRARLALRERLAAYLAPSLTDARQAAAVDVAGK
jgi:RNA polymerase sigma-70 factor, ECF subfamily